MKFVVETEKDKVFLTPSQLLDLLSGKIFSKQQEDIPGLAIEVVRMLGDRMGRVTLQELIALSMQYGYYYRVFIEKNKVAIDNEEVSPITDSTPGDEDSSEASC
jgi:hypothetical protein